MRVRFDVIIRLCGIERYLRDGLSEVKNATVNEKKGERSTRGTASTPPIPLDGNTRCSEEPNRVKYQTLSI